jgi:membrane fusion protein (multidrug efflux system)
MNKIIIIAALAIFISSCHHNHPADLAEEKTDAIQHTETVQIEKASISSVVRIPGELKPFEKVDIYPKLNGFVKEMYVDRGSVVHKGEILMTLEAPEIAQQMESAQGTLLQAQESIGASRDRYFRLCIAARPYIGAGQIPGR